MVAFLCSLKLDYVSLTVCTGLFPAHATVHAIPCNCIAGQPASQVNFGLVGRNTGLNYPQRLLGKLHDIIIHRSAASLTWHHQASDTLVFAEDPKQGLVRNAESIDCVVLVPDSLPKGGGESGKVAC